MKIKLTKNSNKWVDLVKDIYRMSDSQAIEMAVHKCANELTAEYAQQYMHEFLMLDGPEPKSEPKSEPKPVRYLLGQRVIVHDKEIGTVVKPLTGVTNGVLVYMPSLGHESNYNMDSVKPLPNGQL